MTIPEQILAMEAGQVPMLPDNADLLNPVSQTTEAPWERQEGESAKAYAAFVVYRDLGPGRSVDKAYKAYAEGQGKQTGGKRAAGYFVEYAAKYQWKERAEAYDTHLEAKARAANEATRIIEIEQFRTRTRLGAVAQHNAMVRSLKLANRFFDRLEKALDDPAYEVTFRDLAAVLRVSDHLSNAAVLAEAQALNVEQILNELSGTEKGLFAG